MAKDKNIDATFCIENEDLADLISDVFGYGTRIGVYSMLEIYKDVIASKEEKND